MKARKYDAAMDKIYQSMLQKFRRDGLKNTGKLASFYLDVFVFQTKSFRAEEVYGLGFAPAGTFTEVWREEQRKLGYVTWVAIPMGNKIRWEYKIGTALRDYINKGKLLIDEVVTRSEFSSLEQRLEALEIAFDKLIEVKDRPATAAKRKFYTENPERLFQ